MPRGRRSTRGPAAITPSCPLEVVNFIQTPGRPTGAHSRDRAAAARRPGFPSNLRSRTHPGFRSTRTDAGRAKEGNAYAILRSSHSTCSGRAPLGLERFLGFPILRTLVIRPRDTPARSTLARGSLSCRWRPRTPHVRMQTMPRATSAWHKLNPFTRISPTLEFLSPSPHESDSVTTRGNGRMERARHGAEGIFRC